jgi:glycosyltransferase involved in cell wall biosynthesis
MRTGLIATRLAGTDGVSLEVAKWVKVLQRLGHETFYCAGELGGYAAEGTLIPKMHFLNEDVQRINRRAFGQAADEDPHRLVEDIGLLARELRDPLREFIRTNHLDLIIVQNALAIPMNLPLGFCLTDLIAETNIPTIAHHHDFYWERERYQANAFLDFLDTYFPPNLPVIRHVTINTIAQRRLELRRGLDSVVIPNVFDFATPPPILDEYNQDFRQALGLDAETPLIIQPTRVIQRKGIELAIELVSRLGLGAPAPPVPAPQVQADHGWPGKRLFVTHSAGDEGLAYWRWVEREARMMGVSLELVDHITGEERRTLNGEKIYSLADAYLNANLITYPSIYEGFGNALIEAVYYKRPVVVNRYPVYNSDIRPLGFQFIELDGFVDDRAVAQATQIIKSPGDAHDMLESNFAIAREHFSLEMLEVKLKQVLVSF